jgi:hypothetical protein
MIHPELQQLVEAHEQMEMELRASSLVVWAALVKAEPELTTDILRLFSTTDAAARWATSSFAELGSSPARQAAEGRAVTVMSTVRKTDHGFVG